jgi:predicted membrane channel-forming protein YqfA (hemolysin III family)
MREQPTWRIPVGVLALVLALAIYGIVIAAVIGPLIAPWPALAQTPVYLVLGLIWLLPLRRYLIWMETGRWSAPEIER